MISIKKISCMFLLIFITISSNIIAQPFEESLSKQEIKKWFVANIETQKMLWEFQANASDYEDAPLAYGNAKKEWLRENGWDPSNYDKLTERIHGVYNSIQDQEDIDKEKSEIKGQIDEVENNAYLNEEQKEMIKNGMLETINQRQKIVDYFKPDWPAFKLYLQEYEQLDLWISKNRDNPPLIN